MVEPEQRLSRNCLFKCTNSLQCYELIRGWEYLNSLKIRVHCGNSFVPVLMSLQWTFRDTHPRRTTLLRADRTATRLIFEHHGYTSIFVMFFGSGWSSWFLSNQHIFPKYFPPKRKSVKLCSQQDWLWKKSAHTVTYTKCKNLFKIWNISRIKYSYLPWQVLFQYKFPNWHWICSNCSNWGITISICTYSFLTFESSVEF